MKILCINTTARETQLAVIKDDLVYTKISGFTRHSEALFPLLDDLLNISNTTLDDLDAIACVVGPGSFTGIRIGLSVAKGFAFVKKIPIISVTALELLAINKADKTEKKISAVINAGAGLVYYQEFLIKDKSITQITAPNVDKVEHYLGYISANFNNEIEFAYNNNDEKSEPYLQFGEQVNYEIEALIKIAKLKYEKKDFSDAINIAPLYLRVSQAEQDVKNLTFRQATINDIDDILILENQNDTFDLQWSEIATRQSFDNPNYRCYLAYSGDEVKGMVSVMLLAGEAEILRVVVLGSARLNKVGTRLLNFVLETLKKENCKAVFLEVNSKNFPAYSLYKKIGFREVGKRDDYYERGQDAILMRYDL